MDGGEIRGKQGEKEEAAYLPSFGSVKIQHLMGKGRNKYMDNSQVSRLKANSHFKSLKRYIGTHVNMRKQKSFLLDRKCVG